MRPRTSPWRHNGIRLLGDEDEPVIYGAAGGRSTPTVAKRVFVENGGHNVLLSLLSRDSFRLPPPSAASTPLAGGGPNHTINTGGHQRSRSAVAAAIAVAQASPARHQPYPAAIPPIPLMNTAPFVYNPSSSLPMPPTPSHNGDDDGVQSMREGDDDHDRPFIGRLPISMGIPLMAIPVPIIPYAASAISPSVPSAASTPLSQLPIDEQVMTPPPIPFAQSALSPSLIPPGQVFAFPPILHPPPPLPQQYAQPIQHPLNNIELLRFIHNECVGILRDLCETVTFTSPHYLVQMALYKLCRYVTVYRFM
jgi:hypothetical protein